MQELFLNCPNGLLAIAPKLFVFRLRRKRKLINLTISPFLSQAALRYKLKIKEL